MTEFREQCANKLSKTEYLIASKYLCKGLCGKEIARQSGKTLRCVRWHIEQIYSKMHVNSIARFVYKWWAYEC